MSLTASTDLALQVREPSRRAPATIAGEGRRARRLDGAPTGQPTEVVASDGRFSGEGVRLACKRAGRQRSLRARISVASENISVRPRAERRTWEREWIQIISFHPRQMMSAS